MHLKSSCRIVVTGIGLCTPLGSDRESSWKRMIAGDSAVDWLSKDYWPVENAIAGAPVCYPQDRRFKHREPLVELALTTAAESLTHAQLDRDLLNERSVGVVFGTSKGGLHSFTQQLHELRTNSRIESGSYDTSQHRDAWLDVLPNQPASAISQMVGGFGPVLCPIAACATGLAACLRGAELIQSGHCDIVLAGSADASLQPALIGSFRRLGVLSHETSNPQNACRPFDCNRSGFVIGEGAACLVLERFDSAMKRGAPCYAEWFGGRMLSDAHGMTQLDPRGASLERLLQELRRLSPQQPNYINLHGTGTASNDLIESQAVRRVLGSACEEIDCSSLKGGLGHLLGAAGSVELAATILAIRDQIVPPTVNLSDVDPACQLQLTPQKAKPSRIDHAWKLSMGFGGHFAGACVGKLNLT